MPITDIGSYLTTGAEFEAHWANVNADRTASGGSEFLMPDGDGLAELSAAVADADQRIAAVIDADNDRAVAAGTRDLLRDTLRQRIIEFRGAVEFRLGNTGYPRGLPDTPHQQASQQKFLAAMQEAKRLWGKINAASNVPDFTPPMLLRDDYTVAMFTTDMQSLEAAYTAVKNGEVEAKVARGERDKVLPRLRDRFVEYRQAIRVEYGDDHPFAVSLPAVSAAPGSTPQAVEATGIWNDGIQQAIISWQESTAPNVESYQLRYSPPPNYDTQSDQVIATIEPGIGQVITSVGLASPGSTALYRIYVILATGNEAGSNTVSITRPVS